MGAVVLGRTVVARQVPVEEADRGVIEFAFDDQRRNGVVEKEHLAAMLSLNVNDLLDDADDEPQAISCGIPFLCIPLASLDAVKRARLNWEWWDKCLAGYWAPLVYLFSYETEHEGSDVHARMFAVGEGYEEDPATGAAATALAGYLAPRSGRKDGTVHWTIEQGFEINRPSIIKVEADIDDKAVRGIRVGGQSVMISEGTMSVR